MDLEEYLYNKVSPILQSWDEKDIYAISFYVGYNECNVYQNIQNFPEFSVGYNTERDCKNAPTCSEERWNFAFWRQNNVPVIDAVEAADGAAFLLNWYRENGITNIGFEDEDTMYDENMVYIGKGPIGYYELLCAVSNVARRFQTEEIIRNKFGAVPILVHQLEDCWYVEEATSHANPHGEADAYLSYLRSYDNNAFSFMEGKYPASLFFLGFMLNFFIKHFYLILPGIILTVIGIWKKPCLVVGVILLALDFILSLVGQFRLKYAALHDNSPDFKKFQKAILSKEWAENVKDIVEDIIEDAAKDETDEELAENVKDIVKDYIDDATKDETDKD